MFLALGGVVLKMDWFKFYPNAFAHGVVGLTLEETGAYVLLFCAIYARDAKLPNDDLLLARVCNCEIRTFRRLKAALIRKEKIWIENNCILAKRVQRTIDQALSSSEVQRKNAKKRWENNGRVYAIENLDKKEESFFGESQSPKLQTENWGPVSAELRSTIIKAPGGSLATAPPDGALRSPPSAVPEGEAPRPKLPHELTAAEAIAARKRAKDEPT